MTYGVHQLSRSVIRAELRQWREVHLRESSYFAGHIYGDRLKQKKDGATFITGFLMFKVDRGYYWLIKTAGKHVYILKKDQAYDPDTNPTRRK